MPRYTFLYLSVNDLFWTGNWFFSILVFSGLPFLVGFLNTRGRSGVGKWPTFPSWEFKTNQFNMKFYSDLCRAQAGSKRKTETRFRNESTFFFSINIVAWFWPETGKLWLEGWGIFWEGERRWESRDKSVEFTPRALISNNLNCKLRWSIPKKRWVKVLYKYDYGLLQLDEAFNFWCSRVCFAHRSWAL